MTNDLNVAQRAYEYGVPSTEVGPPLGMTPSTLIKRLRANGASIRGKGGGRRLSSAELEAFRLGVRDGGVLASPDDELDSGVTWPDSRLNELYDHGVNVGASGEAG